MLLTLHQQVREVRAAPALIDYILALVQRTRELPGLRQGLSPRAGLGLRRAAQAWALIEGRSGVIPEDVQAVRSEEHTSELQSLMRISYGVLCLKKKIKNKCTAIWE